MKKSIISLCLSLVLFLFSAAFPVYAQEVTEANRLGDFVTMSEPGVAVPMYDGIQAGTSGYISNYYGTLTCTLGRYVSSGYIQAIVSPSTASGNVDCFVKLPNGFTKGLGSVPASGGSTQKVPMYTLQSGTYTFIFQSTTNATLSVAGYIY